MNLIAIILLLAAGSAKAPNPEVQATYKEIQSTFGAVPGFFKLLPDALIAPAWEQMRDVQLNPKTALPGKVKELIGLGVAAQIPCRYCIYFHTKAAQLQGATDDEVKEAIAVSALTRQWSTVLNGYGQDDAAFKAEVAQLVEGAKKAMSAPPPAGTPPPVTDAKSAYAEAQMMFGTSPSFMKFFPEEGAAGAWKELRNLEFNPNAAINGKYQGLIDLAVASQVPCRYCVYMDKEFLLKVEGATEREVIEAVAIASIVRHWSTVLNGSQYDEAKFKREVDAAIAHVKASMKTQQAKND